jgi:hypothetical protein
LVFWCAALYTCVLGFHSITEQVFWPATTQWDAECGEGIASLESELLARASAEVAEGGARSNERTLREWLRDWDARHATLRDRCTGNEERAHYALAKLRQRVEAMLQRSAREQAPLVRDIARRTGGRSTL